MTSFLHKKKSISTKKTLFLMILLLLPVVSYAAESPTLSFSIIPQNLIIGDQATVSWFASNVSNCKLSGSFGNGFPYPPSYSVTVSPKDTGSYNINIVCGGPSGFVTDVKTMFVSKTGISPAVIINNPTPTGPIPVPNTPIPIVPPANLFTAACAANSSRTETNKIISFAAAQTGGIAPLFYRWSGDIVGSQQVENIAFEHAGVKTARITITDARGLSAEGNCSVVVNAIVSVPEIKPVSTASVPKKPPVTVANIAAPVCRTVTLCIDTNGNVIQKDSDGGTEVAHDSEKNNIETADHKNGAKSFFLASLFGSGNEKNNGGDKSQTVRNFAVYLLPIFAAAFVIFIGYTVVKMSKKV